MIRNSDYQWIYIKQKILDNKFFEQDKLNWKLPNPTQMQNFHEWNISSTYYTKSHIFLRSACLNEVCIEILL